jgi:hypothetical protein
MEHIKQGMIHMNITREVHIPGVTVGEDMRKFIQAAPAS